MADTTKWERRARTLAQAVHDARGVLGFDNDGDETPALGENSVGWNLMAESVVREAREVRAQIDEADDEYIALERRAERAEQALADADTDGDRLWQQGREAGYRDALIALAENRGQFVDELDRHIADSLRKDREYVEAHDAAVLRDAVTAQARVEALLETGVYLADQKWVPVAEVRRALSPAPDAGQRDGQKRA